MCGIAGYIGGKPLNNDCLKKASQVLSHRGPDGEGFFCNNTQDQCVSLVHRRLAIIDLSSRSDQPFHYNDTVLIYNGEIYNYLEVRKDLEVLGHKFKTTSDTEVLIHALYEWGENALNKLDGMWSFAWYNKQNNVLLLSRDRFGEKPLYLWNTDNGLFFASEIKGLAALAGRWPNINDKHLIRYLVNGYKCLYKTKETFFHKIEQVPSGTYIKINSRKINPPTKYWSPSFIEDKNLNYKDCVQQTKENIIDVVRLRMRSDVPVAFCMSGGIDSNTLISVASKILGHDVHGFTIVNEDKRYDEQTLVDQAVKELDIKHTPINLSKKNFLTNMRLLVKAHDAPISTISYYVHWLLMENIKKCGYKISISGTGADELFSGYYDHHLLYLASISDDKSLFNQSVYNWKNYIFPHVRNKYLQNHKRFINNPNFRNHIYSGKNFSDVLYEFDIETFHEKIFPTSLLRKRMLNELFEEVVPVILNEDDLNAMFYSIENRSPFLDRKLFETSLKFQTKYLIKDGKTKSILREAMKNIVPDTILKARKKVGFNAPIEDLLDINNKDVREQILDDNLIFKYVKKEAIEKKLKLKTITNSESKFLFSFLGVKLFLEEFKG